ncbi:MAG: DNA-binding protein WhiA [Firmicutes bacterium]|nr:DNA-binding protein WhiA [Bacillota bacterium]MBR6503911.1 DNA-binding protein WhiA [Bacillota bacterium]
MSFSSDTKAELCMSIPDKRCCMLAEITGLLRCCGSVRFVGMNKVAYRLVTENAAVARKIIRLMKEYFDIRMELNISKSMVLKKNHFYEMIITEDMRCEAILRETGILRVRNGFNNFSFEVDESIIKKKCCKRAFLRGVFLGSGSVTDPGKGYHLEIVCANPVFARDIQKVMNQFRLGPKEMQRKDTTVVYLKDSNMISDFLGIIGASKSLLELENTKALKETKNRANRVSNCDDANIEKTISASQRTIEAIKKIQRVKGMDWLPPKLQEIAVLRLEEPESTLQELGQLLDPPLGKSGVTHRLAKIEEMAAKIKE